MLLVAQTFSPPLPDALKAERKAPLRRSTSRTASCSMTRNSTFARGRWCEIRFSSSTE